MNASSPAAPTPQIRLVLVAVFAMVCAQMALNPVLAPLSRELGLAEWQLGVTISTAAVMVVLTSQLWGRSSQSWGRKPVLAAAIGLGVISTGLFAAVAAVGMTGALTVAVLFVLFLVLRGVLFGTAMAAVLPTAQAYIADTTPDERSRVKGMAAVGAVQGMAMILGSAAGGALAVFGLIAPLIAVPIGLATAMIVVAIGLRREEPAQLVATPARLRPTDTRVWPFLLAGFGIFTSLGFIQIITGFIVQDRLGLDGENTGLLTGAAMLVAGLAMMLSQGLVVPRSGWDVPTLLRIGSAIAVLGFAVLIPDWGAAALFASMALIGFGIGTAMPGFSVGPTLLVDRHEQGGVAGLVGATTGLTFVVAPTAGSVLYGWWPLLPIIAGAAMMAAVTAFVVLAPHFRRIPSTPPGAQPQM